MYVAHSGCIERRVRIRERLRFLYVLQVSSADTLTFAAVASPLP